MNTSEKIESFLEKKRQGINLNDHIRKQKEFHNPEILDKVINHFSINQYGSNFMVHDAIKPENYYKALVHEQKNEKRTIFVKVPEK